MRNQLFILLVSFLGLSFSSLADANTTCGRTNPRLCVGDVVWTQKGVEGWNGTYEAKVTAVSTDFLSYSVQLAQYSNSASEKTTKSLGVTTPGKCTPSNPKVCIGDLVYTNKGVDGWNGTYRAKVIALADNNSKITVKLLDYSNVSSNNSLEAFAITNRCGKGNPRFCVGDTAISKAGIDHWRGNYRGTIVAVSSSLEHYTFQLRDNSIIHSNQIPSGLAIVTRSNPGGIDGLAVSLSLDTQDLANTYKDLSSVTTKDRSQFLKALQAQVTALNSSESNLMAGFVLSKLVRLSTAQVVRDNFEPEVAKFLSEIEKLNWKSIMQIPANEQTISFAIRVIESGVRIRNSQAQVSSETEIRLKTLASAAAKKGTFAKAIALREFLSANVVLIEDLISDPRHGAIGSIVADTAQWVNKQFEE